MKSNKKKILIDILILVVPVFIILLLMPILPEKISIHRGLYDRSIDKKYSPLLAIIPFVIYKIKYNRK